MPRCPTGLLSADSRAPKNLHASVSSSRPSCIAAASTRSLASLSDSPAPCTHQLPSFVRDSDFSKVLRFVASPTRPSTSSSSSPVPPGVPSSPRSSCPWRHLQGLQHLCRPYPSSPDSPSRASRISKQVPLSRLPLPDSPLSLFCCWCICTLHSHNRLGKTVLK